MYAGFVIDLGTRKNFSRHYSQHFEKKILVIQCCSSKTVIGDVDFLVEFSSLFKLGAFITFKKP
jgi:hypothetical protein